MCDDKEPLAHYQQLLHGTERVTWCAGVTQSVWRLAREWTVRGSNQGSDEVFRTLPDRSWGPASLLYKGYQVSFPGLKRPRHDVYHPFSFSKEVKERSELYIYFTSAPSWQVLGWNQSCVCVCSMRADSYRHYNLSVLVCRYCATLHVLLSCISVVGEFFVCVLLQCEMLGAVRHTGCGGLCATCRIKELITLSFRYSRERESNSRQTYHAPGNVLKPEVERKTTWNT